MKPALRTEIPRISVAPDEAGYQVKYVFGESGIYSKLFFDNDGVVALHAAGGFTFDTTGTMTLEEPICKGNQTRQDSLCNTTFVPSRLLFFTKSDTLLVGTSEANLSVWSVSTLSAPPLSLQKASEAVGAWGVTHTDTSYSFSFFADLRYRLSTTGTDGSTLETGTFDVQKDQLLIHMNLCASGCTNFYKAVKDNGNLLLTAGGSSVTDTLIGSVLEQTIAPSSLLGQWRATAETHLFQLSLLDGGIIKLEVFSSAEDPLYTDTGIFETLGQSLTLDFNDGKSCTGNGSVGVAGADGKMHCFSVIVGDVTLSADSLIIGNGDLPTRWSKVTP